MQHGRGSCDPGLLCKEGRPKGIITLPPTGCAGQMSFCSSNEATLFKNQTNQTSVNNCMRVTSLIATSKARSNVSCCTSYITRVWTPSARGRVSSEPFGAVLKSQRAGAPRCSFPFKSPLAHGDALKCRRWDNTTHKNEEVKAGKVSPEEKCRACPSPWRQICL